MQHHDLAAVARQIEVAAVEGGQGEGERLGLRVRRAAARGDRQGQREPPARVVRPRDPGGAIRDRDPRVVLWGMASDNRRETTFVGEDVERRSRVRGPVRDLVAELPGGAHAVVTEAGDTAIFIEQADPDALALGARLEIVIVGAGGRAPARVEVVRKEIHPRRGVALLLVHLAPDALATYRGLRGE
ncbi:MAG: hypothetical protein K8W52_27175 [Deltaproteobacteria bacterium]|nr:hypothetical protein [Deltaproteobacteria bacterium]